MEVLSWLAAKAMTEATVGGHGRHPVGFGRLSAVSRSLSTTDTLHWAALEDFGQFEDTLRLAVLCQSLDACSSGEIILQLTGLAMDTVFQLMAQSSVRGSDTSKSRIDYTNARAHTRYSLSSTRRIFQDSSTWGRYLSQV